jgi:hypothetical protein
MQKWLEILHSIYKAIFHKKIQVIIITRTFLAEREGFEPPDL